jgi:hypothetical protein
VPHPRPTATNCAFEFLLYRIFLKFCIYPININFFKFGLRTLFVLLLNVGDCVKVFVKFQFPKFPNNIITFPITVDFDNYCNFWSSRPQVLNRYKFQSIKYRWDGATISVKGWFLLQLFCWTLGGFQVILMYNFSHFIKYFVKPL